MKTPWVPPGMRPESDLMPPFSEAPQAVARSPRLPAEAGGDRLRKLWNHEKSPRTNGVAPFSGLLFALQFPFESVCDTPAIRYGLSFAFIVSFPT
jgi:hypothetical protein